MKAEKKNLYMVDYLGGTGNLGHLVYRSEWLGYLVGVMSYEQRLDPIGKKI